MPHSSNRELIFGIMVGTAGISLLLLCYCKVRKSRTAMNLPKFLSLGNTFDSITLQDEMHNGQGTIAVSQRRQLQILEKLNELLTNMEELKEEIRFLKETVPKLEEYIQGELGGKVAAHKISPQHRTRKRRVTTVQSSATSNSSEEAESEGGYITANTDTEEPSFPVSKALNTHVEELSLDVLLQKVDHLRMNESDKQESFELLCDHKEKFKDEVEFMWRFARGYGDMYEMSTNTQEKKHYANIGKTLGERAVSRAPMNGHCHLWYAVLCGYVSEFEGLQNKINYGHCFKEHLDIAIQLLPEEPFLYYLKGRYCYTISKLSWIEKKMAATLFGKIPSSTVQEALQNFLKSSARVCSAEEQSTPPPQAGPRAGFPASCLHRVRAPRAPPPPGRPPAPTPPLSRSPGTSNSGAPEVSEFYAFYTPRLLTFPPTLRRCPSRRQRPHGLVFSTRRPSPRSRPLWEPSYTQTSRRLVAAPTTLRLTPCATSVSHLDDRA